MQRLKKALAQPELTGFLPDGKTLEDVTSIVGSIGSTKGNLIGRDIALRFALGAQESATTLLHDGCVAAYANMRSVYRRDVPSLRAIRRIPKRDQTPAQTLTRGDLTAQVWAGLPNMPGTGTPFKVGSLTLTTFNGWVADLRTKNETAEGLDSAYQVGLSNLTNLQIELGNFASAAVAQGRSQYPEGSAARVWLDAIPLEPSTVPPVQVVITEATSPEPGVSRLVFDAEHATSFIVKRRLLGQAEFETVADDFTDEVFEEDGLAAGVYEYIVIGHNSRGDGPPSAVATVTIAIAAAA
jgi:hypothetical protein